MSILRRLQFRRKKSPAILRHLIRIRILKATHLKFIARKSKSYSCEIKIYGYDPKPSKRVLNIKRCKYAISLSLFPRREHGYKSSI